MQTLPIIKSLTIKCFLVSALAWMYVPAANAQIDIEATVVDADSQEPMVYCHVYNLKSQSGTITNEDGQFVLNIAFGSDSIRISYIGYHTEIVLARSLQNNAVIALRPQSIILDETVVVDEDPFLHKAIAKCRKYMLKQPEQTSRAYFNMETTSGDVPLEMMQCYYNAISEGCAVNALHLKNGRAGLPKPEDGYFVSLNTTKAIVMLDITNAHHQFPANPLQLTAQQNRKIYNLVRLPSYSDENTLHIAFIPKRAKSHYFEGEFWIDMHTFALQKAILTSTDAKVHPFTPINHESSIGTVGFEIKQTYVQEGQQTFLDHVDFAYSLEMLMRVDHKLETLDLQTRGLLYLYEKGSAFILPFFEYDDRHNDYRKISFVPYDEAFWDENWGFKYSALQLKRLAFFRQSGVLLNFQDVFRSTGLWHANNLLWNEANRVRLKLAGKPDIRRHVNVGVQLFLDVNEGENGLRYTSATVLDAFRTYNFLEESKLMNCYVNIYFDVAEIIRRDMMHILEEGPKTEVFARKTYREVQGRMEKSLARYAREVKLGKNLSFLKEWNDYVKEHLDIDNIEKFGISTED